MPHRRKVYGKNAAASRATGARGASALAKGRIGLIAAVCILILVIAIVVVVNRTSHTDADATMEEQPVANEETENPNTITVTFAGDCTLGSDEVYGYNYSFAAKYDEVNDPTFFFANVADIFENDDLSVVNFEGTLTDSTDRRADKVYAFKGDPQYAEILSSSSVEAADLANNHTWDYGEESYYDTIDALDDAGITSFGYDRIAYFDIKGIKVALLGVNEHNQGEDALPVMVERIERAKDEGAGLILVYMHWGNEMDTVPDEMQMEFGRAAIDAGADLVVGSHPHVIQGYEVYEGKYIVYSLGNFSFGGNNNPTDKDCLIFQQTFNINDDGSIEIGDDVSFIPCSVSAHDNFNNFQPTPATGSELIRITQKLEERTEELAAKVEEIYGE
ncbi:MAG: CapA family protein [Eggerthellaceae bacterium]|nr:CapA family protein [Eggerthellaceae bacterium]